MSTGIFSAGKGGRCLGLTTLTPSCAGCLEIWVPQTPQTLRACPGLYRNCFIFLFGSQLHCACTSTKKSLSSTVTCLRLINIHEFPFLHYGRTCSFPVHIAFKAPPVRLAALFEDDDPVYSLQVERENIKRTQFGQS